MMNDEEDGCFQRWIGSIGRMHLFQPVDVVTTAQHQTQHNNCSSTAGVVNVVTDSRAGAKPNRETRFTCALRGLAPERTQITAAGGGSSAQVK